MKYNNCVEGFFIERPNRFIAKVMIDGKVETVHVKNTGRCKELLQPGAKVILEDHRGEGRKTDYDLVSVYKGNRLINMDSQAPNRMVKEYLLEKQPFGEITFFKPEYTYGKSRVDFYLETMEEDGIKRSILLEVKGVTLEQNNMVKFPDAPTLRGIKHIEELEGSLKEGYEAYIWFVIQMDKVTYFTPNDDTHPEFGTALRRAAKNGVGVQAFDCDIRVGEMWLQNPVEVRLS